MKTNLSKILTDKRNLTTKHFVKDAMLDSMLELQQICNNTIIIHDCLDDIF